MQVALGRCSLDPLPVLASLCGPSAEILAMALHPLKDLLPRAELLAAAERVCITAINQARMLCCYNLVPACRPGMQPNVGSSTRKSFGIICYSAGAECSDDVCMSQSVACTQQGRTLKILQAEGYAG